MRSVRSFARRFGSGSGSDYGDDEGNELLDKEPTQRTDGPM